MSEGERYFTALSEALSRAGYNRPTLVVDLDRLYTNIEAVKSALPANLGLRLVDKSLPSLPLISLIMEKIGTSKIMSFHLPITLEVLEAFPQADILFGKPMPAAAVKASLTTLEPDKRTQLIERVTWLIDTPERLKQYGEIAEAEGAELRFAFEVDCGMHRGGFPTPRQLGDIVSELSNYPSLKCEGVMGYEAHIPEIPAIFGGPSKEKAHSEQRLAAFIAVLPQEMRQILNTGGSKTSLTYQANGPANEVSMGSGFLMPTDFDVAALSALEPAVYIATPVLKTVDAKLPGPAFMTKIVQSLGLFPRSGCFIYGGKWYAEPVWPEGMRENGLWGHSSNQQFMALPQTSTIKADDIVFFRPTQSEAILQQFGPIAVYSGGNITTRWPVIHPC